MGRRSPRKGQATTKLQHFSLLAHFGKEKDLSTICSEGKKVCFSFSGLTRRKEEETNGKIENERKKVGAYVCVRKRGSIASFFNSYVW